MSRVFLVRDEALDREVVIKLMPADLAQSLSADRFAREIKLAAALQEPHIVPLLNAGLTSDGLPWYSMPFIAGESLRIRLARGPVSITEAVGLLRNVAQALSYAHAQGIIHRDIKPENILISSGTAVVTDFGIAKALSAAKADAPGGTLTQVGTSIGTPAYMAPEQALGDAKTDRRSDLYAWGVVAYETISGFHPFAGKTSAQQLIAAHLTEVPAPLATIAPDVPVSVAALVMKCLEKDQANRPASAGELVEVLSGSGATTPLPSKAPWPRASSVSRRPTVRRVAAALAIPVLMVAGLTIYRLRPTRATTTAISTVAVLPFENIGGDSRAEYFSDGMTDAFAEALSRLPSLRVAGRTSAFSFKGKHPTAEEVGRLLHVDGIIEGTVRHDGDRVRITVQLSNTADNFLMWSKTVEKKATDVFQLEDEVTREMIATIAPAFGRQAATNVADGNRGTSDPGAYDLYLRGRYFFFKRGGANLTQAIAFFLRAIAKDPSFAQAHAGLAQTYAVLPTYARVPADSMAALATASADRAISIGAALGDAHAAKAYALVGNLELGDAQREFETAIGYDPANPTIRHWHSILLNALGLDDSSYAEEARAEAIDPLSAVFANHQAHTLLYLGRIAESEERSRRAITFDASNPIPLNTLAMAQVVRQQPDSAIATLKRAPAPVLATSRWLNTLAIAHAEKGEWRDVDGLTALDSPAEGTPMSAMIEALLAGDRRKALDAMERGFTPSGGMIYVVLSPACDPLLEPLRDEPRYRALLSRLGVRECATRTRWKFPTRRP